MSILTKAQIRKSTLERVKAMDHNCAVEQEEKLLARLKQHISSTNISSILLYNPIIGEVNISSIMEYCAECGIDTYLPRVVGDNIEIALSANGSVVGAYGIREPIGQAVNIMTDMIIVPCVAMTANGARLGRGKGYYDRYLSSYSGLTVAVIYREQLVDYLPVEEHDIIIDVVITAEGV